MATINAKTKTHPESVSVEYELPETLDGLVEKFGAEVVASAAQDAFTISIQALMRRNIEKTGEELQEIVDAWVPGVRQAGVRKTPFEKATAALKGMSDEERAELLRRLQAVEE